MTVVAAVPDLVATATTALARAQWRVAASLAGAEVRGAWATTLHPDDRWRLVRSGHFTGYAGELDWTPLEVAGHLRDSAQIFAARLHRLCTEDDPVLPDFATDAPERLADYRATAPEALLDQLRTAQADLLQAVAAVRGPELDRSGTHETDGPLTVADVLTFLPGHQRDHARQLRALLSR
jgi:DinB superfamily